ncbi:hypothetical protein M2139_000242 [Enterococcus sp. PF1-24]|uniref:hypothetical protein n=1 Tax=unclassified Enterococcus TaxID=2608891 RepID=UPI002475F58C|nr:MULTISPECIES: hypothetical protein [unclassified Enterococcus]MDH6363338.1 hypothetical protein [Enterococcus sp. PFB1-1]MDH6400361.1 hypothetical protein [Enterococcus sp. PF1-24]
MNLKKINQFIVISIAVLAAFATIYGIFSNQAINKNQTFTSIHGEIITLYGKGLYHNESLAMAAQVKAQDWVTLLIAIPFLLFALHLSNNGSLIGKFFLTGTLAYFLYSYATYCFVAMYNRFFLIFILLMGLAFYGFIINFTSFDLTKVNNYFSKIPARKYLGYSTILLGCLIAIMWLGRIFPSLSGEIPDTLEHYTTLPIQALDLAIVVPASIISGILLLQKKPLGSLLTPIIIIKGITLLLAIDAMALAMLVAGAAISVSELVIFPALTILFSFNLYLMLQPLKSQKSI